MESRRNVVKRRPHNSIGSATRVYRPRKSRSRTRAGCGAGAFAFEGRVRLAACGLRPAACGCRLGRSQALVAHFPTHFSSPCL